MSFIQLGGWQPHDATGRRKYLTAGERCRLLAAADMLHPGPRVLTHALTYTGCRISEALALGPHRLDIEGGAVVLQTLKRRRLCFRRVPIPDALIEMLLALPVTEGRYWPVHRATAWRHVKHAMTIAGIEGPMATAKGLRHAFGIHAAAHSVPPSLIQRWMGHASLSTTTLYLDAVGPEEREFAERMWG